MCIRSCVSWLYPPWLPHHKHSLRLTLTEQIPYDLSFGYEFRDDEGMRKVKDVASHTSHPQGIVLYMLMYP